MNDDSLELLETQLNRAVATTPLAPFAIALCALLGLPLLSTPMWPVVAVALVGAGVGTRRLLQRDKTLRTVHRDYAAHESDSRFSSISRACEAIAGAKRLWLVTSEAATTDWKRNAGAQSSVDRTPAACRAGRPHCMKSNVPIWALQQAGAGPGRLSIHFLPDCVLVYRGRYKAYKYEVVSVTASVDNFVESEPPPSDAPLVGTTWQHPRKDGGADLRFRENRQLPVLQYGRIALRFPTGVFEFQVSCPTASTQLLAVLGGGGSHRRHSASSQDRRRDSRQEGGGTHTQNPTQATLRDPYLILGVSPTATEEELRRAYRARVLEYHPDRVAQLGSRLRDVANEEIRAINDAWERIKTERRMPN